MFRPTDDENGGLGDRRESQGTELADLPLELIERRISEYAAQLNAGSCRLIEHIAEFDRREGWAGSGCLSCADWIAWRTALSPRAAREQVRVARALPELPLMHAEFASGKLSYSKLRALTRVASADSEADLLELSHHATAAQLERMLRTFRRLTPDDAMRAHERAFLAWGWEDDGSLSVRARLAAEHGAAFLRAMEAAKDGLWEERREETKAEADATESAGGSAEPLSLPQTGESGGSAEPHQASPPPITNVEGFHALVETARSHGSASTSVTAAERYQVNVFVDAGVLTGDADGRCELSDQVAIAPETARKLACEGSLVRILERDGEILSVGRRTRSISPAMRRALLARDRVCRFPGCERARFLDAHHIEHWAKGGETKLENLCLLCGGHHDVCHEGGWTVEGDANGELVFRSPHGWALDPSPPLGPATPDDLLRASAAAGLDIGPATLYPGTGEKMDLGNCVEAVVAACGERGG